jgi:transposase InsO family protein
MTGDRIARRLGLPRSTVGAVLRRIGLGRLKALDPPAPVVRYERERPGELLHLDTKKLGRIDGIGHRITGYHEGVRRNRGIGWEVLHVCIDDASRLAYTELLPDEKKQSAIAFLDRALHWFERLGIAVERVMTDNGSAYRSHDFRARLKEAGIRHIRTRPYTPRTNGKAERFIQTSLREWAYARAYQSSAERGQAMNPWIADYNHNRPHSALGGRPPFEKLNNVLGFDT